MNKYLRVLKWILQNRSVPKYRDGKFYATYAKQSKEIIRPERIVSMLVSLEVSPENESAAHTAIGELGWQFMETRLKDIIMPAQDGYRFEFNWEKSQAELMIFAGSLKAKHLSILNYRVEDEISRQTFTLEEREI